MRNMNRRLFIKKSAVLLAAGSMAGQEMVASVAVKRNKGCIGLQLWSIRPEMTDDFAGSLKKIAAMGYSAIETFGTFREGEKFFGYTTKEIDVMAKYIRKATVWLPVKLHSTI